MRQIVISGNSSQQDLYQMYVDEGTFNIMKPGHYGLHEKPKRFRSAFSTDQINYLEEQYKRCPYIDREKRQKLAAILSIDERPIKIWFQNRRMKDKRDGKEFELGNNILQLGKDRLNNIPALLALNDRKLYPVALSCTPDIAAHARNNDMKLNSVDSKETLVTQPNTSSSTTPIIESEISAPRPNFYREINDEGNIVNTIINEQPSEDTPLSLVKINPNIYEQPTNDRPLSLVKNSPDINEQPTVDTPLSLVKNSPNINKQPTKDTPLSLIKSDNNKKTYQEYKSTSAEFSTNTDKKHTEKSTSAGVSSINKKDHKVKTEPKNKSKLGTNNYNFPKFNPKSTKCNVSNPASEIARQMNAANPLYNPLYNPGVFSSPMASLPPPYVAPDGIMWKPVKYMPVGASSPPVNTGQQAPPAHEQDKKCTCNCHKSSPHVPVTFPANLHHRLAQYVVTVPFSSSSSKP